MRKIYWAAETSAFEIIALASLLVSRPIIALAQLPLPSTNEVFSGNSGLQASFGRLEDIIRFIFNFIIIIAGTVFVIMLLIGGIQYLTSAGNEEGTGKAKKLMIDAIIGLILTLSAWAIGNFILRQVGLR